MEPAPNMTDRAGDVHRWGRWEGVFESASDYDNPVQDVDLRATLTSPSGTQTSGARILGWWPVWRVRFSPDEVGEWRYQVAFSEATDAGSHGRSGSFSVTEFEGENPLYRHGQIQVAPSGRYLAHADGTPFFFLADTCWNGPHLSEPGEWDTTSPTARPSDSAR